LKFDELKVIENKFKIKMMSAEAEIILAIHRGHKNVSAIVSQNSHSPAKCRYKIKSMVRSGAILEAPQSGDNRFRNYEISDEILDLLRHIEIISAGTSREA